MKIIKKERLEGSTIKKIINGIDFQMPLDFVNFFAESNGAEIYSGNGDCNILWPLTEIVELNSSYKVNEYASDYFIFGSNGGDTAYCINKITGGIFEIPFIGMSNHEAVFKSKSLREFLSVYTPMAYP